MCLLCGDGMVNQPWEECDGEDDAACPGECQSNCACSGPLNNRCEDRIPIFDGETIYDTIDATTDGLYHPGCSTPTYHDIWYNYEATCTGVLTVSTCDNANYRTDLVIYDGYYPVDWSCPPITGHMLACSTINHDCPGHTSELVVPATVGNWYTIRVGGWKNGDMGTGTLTVTCGPGCGDGICEGEEECCNCEFDCGPCVCGDGICDGPCEACDECEDCRGCVCAAPLVYDNGHWTGVNGGAPSAGWSLAGCVDDFVLPDPDFGGTSFSCAQVGFYIYWNTTPPTAWDLRIYDLNDVDGQGGGDGTIAGLGDFNLAVPRCFLAYSVDDGSMIVTNTDDCGFGGCFFVFDGVGEVCDLAPGSYGFHVMFPGTGAENFWMTAPQDDSECLAVWGPAEPFPFDFCESAGPEFQAMHFNMRGFQPCEQCPFDSNDDGQVGPFDLANLLGAWGECAGDECLCVDADADGQVDAFDLANLLGVWGPCQ
ncbi:MAG: hypothetical protein IID34_15645 [Planctomycetes bacterium]|nr:hypothetical protein [Planctomycetota bacterium]